MELPILCGDGVQPARFGDQLIEIQSAAIFHFQKLDELQ